MGFGGEHNIGLSNSEREIRFYVPFSELESNLKISELPRTNILQAYFEESYLQEVCELVLNLTGLSDMYNHASFSSARLRRERYDDIDIYSLEIKGAKRGPSELKIQRPELSVKISRTLFNKLRPFATKGCIEKTRYIVEGLVFGHSGEGRPVSAQIDQFNRIGPDAIDRALGKRTKFCLIDVEFPSLDLALAFRQGHHNFQFLRGAIEVSSLKKRVRKILASRRLAERGLDRNLVKCIQLMSNLYRAT